MGYADDLKKLGAEIVTSYNARILGIDAVKADTAKLLKTLQKGSTARAKDIAKLLKGFRVEHKAMAGDLEEFLSKVKPALAKAEGARVKETRDEIKARMDAISDLLARFDKEHGDMAKKLAAALAKVKPALAKAEAARVKETRDEIKARMDAISDLLARFDKEHREMADKLADALAKVKPALAKAEAERVKETVAAIKARMNAVSDLLARFDKEHREMADKLADALAKVKPALAKGEAARAKETQAEIKERVAKVSTLLDEMKSEREKAASEWLKLTEAMARARGKAVPKPEAVKAVAVKEVAPPVKAKLKKKLPKLTGKQKDIFTTVKENPDGITLPEIAYAMGVPFVTLARDAKKLLDLKVIEKKENRYYPA